MKHPERVIAVVAAFLAGLDLGPSFLTTREPEHWRKDARRKYKTRKPPPYARPYKESK